VSTVAARRIVFDLEGVLVVSVFDPVLHPEAREVLERANADFAETLLWTFAGIQEAHRTLERHDLLGLFHRIVGQDRESEDLLDVVWRPGPGGWELEAELEMEAFEKDLSLLGDPDDLAMISDDHFVVPDDRAVFIPPFDGQPGHSLLGPYRAALGLFA
jgi:hypothetical protein